MAENHTGGFYIEYDRHGAALYGGGGGGGECMLPRHAPLRISFDCARADSAGPDPLRKAVGGAAHVIDATAGWGADAAHLARRGIKVTAVERNPLVVAMLRHAHAKCRDPAVRDNLTIVHADSVAWLREMRDAGTPPEVVYIDPMYPLNPKSAAAKKPLAVLRVLIGAADPLALFAQAMTCATRRVVVKRPTRARPLAGGKVGEITGKLVRFDIYQPRPEAAAGAFQP